MDLKEGECDSGGSTFKLKNYVKFSVEKIVVSPEKEITDLVIVDNRGEVRYSMHDKAGKKETGQQSKKVKTKPAASKSGNEPPPLPRPLNEMSVTQLKAVKNSPHLEFYHKQVDEILETKNGG